MSTKGIVCGLALVIAMSGVGRGLALEPERNVATAVPAISIQTSVLAEINVGTKTQVAIIVKNGGQSVAEGVSIHAKLPDSVSYQSAVPEPSMKSEHTVQFEIGDLEAGSERRIIIDLVPQRPGPVDLETKAYFAASTRSALQVRRPEVVIDSHAPEAVVVGEEVEFRVVLENVGDGIARDVVLTPDFPTAADSESRPAPETTSLRGSETQEYRFTARATEGEWLVGQFVAVTADGRQVESESRVRILHPALHVKIEGPRGGFVKQEGEYEILVSNPGDTTIEQGAVTLLVPEGLRVTAISEEAHVEDNHRKLVWCLEPMEPGKSVSLMVKALATQVGAHRQTVVAEAAPRLVDQDEHLTLVFSRANVDVSVTNRTEANEVGAAERFTVHLKNRGSRAAEYVAVQVLLPDAMVPLESSDYAQDGQQISFPALQLKPGEERALSFQATGVSAGEFAVRARLESDSSRTPIVAETTVYFFDQEELERLASEADDSVRMR